MSLVALPIRRHLLFSLLAAGLLLTFGRPLRQLAVFIAEHEHYSHIALIPLVTAYLLYINRWKVFPGAKYHWPAAVALFGMAGAALGLRFAFGARLSENDVLSLTMLALYLLLLGAFLFCYGPASFRAGRFPLLFLILGVPLPDFILTGSIQFLQYRSADLTGVFFGWTGMPFLQDGLTYHLPGLTILVAEECSGIRSSLALFITGVLAGHFFLRSGWSRLALLLLIVPIAVLKNGIRITTLTVLAVRVDRGFLDGSLHQQGGFVFFGIALLVMGAAVWLLQKGERRLLPAPPKEGHAN